MKKRTKIVIRRCHLLSLIEKLAVSQMEKVSVGGVVVRLFVRLFVRCIAIPTLATLAVKPNGTQKDFLITDSICFTAIVTYPCDKPDPYPCDKPDPYPCDKPDPCKTRSRLLTSESPCGSSDEQKGKHRAGRYISSSENEKSPFYKSPYR